MKFTQAQHRGFAAIALALLTACSNGRGSVSDPAGPVGGPSPQPPPAPPPTPPPDPPPAEPSSAAMAGYWKGTAIEQDSDRRFDAVALVDAQGNAQWLLTREAILDDSGFVLFGNVCCGSQFEDQITGKELGETRTRNGSAQANVDGAVLSGDLRFDGEDYGFTLNRSADYDRAVPLTALAGVYSRRTSTIFGEEVTLTLTIDSDGRLTGSYSNGGVFNGNASIPDPTHNMVQLQIDLANCGSHGSSKQWNGAYTGLGVLLSGDEVFYHSVIGPTWLGPQSVER